MLWFGKKKDEEQTETAPAAVTADASAPVSDAASVPANAPAPAPAADSVPGPASVPKAEPERTVPAAAVPPADNSKNQPSKKALYYNLMNALYDAVLVVDMNGHIMDCNERVDTIFGYSSGDVWDMPISQLVPGIDARVFAQMKAVLRDNRRVLVNARCRRKDGTPFHGEVGAGLMELIGEDIVLSIRNIEKRTPVKAIVRPPNAPKNAPEQ